MEKFALIVAGGNGSRMGSEIPKQFLNIAGKPILMRTIEKFSQYDSSIHFFLVLPSGEFDRWKNLCKKHHFEIQHKLVKGGNSRFLSVKNGLSQIPNTGIVFIHDGVRPLVSLKTLSLCEEMAKTKGNALPVIQVNESLRIIGKDGSHAVDRAFYRLVQTPQTFRTDLIKRAYFSIDDNEFTDDASVFETLDKTINLVKGNSENIKITCPVDLKIAETLYPVQG